MDGQNSDSLESISDVGHFLRRPQTQEEILDEMRETIEKLKADDASRGDLKILSRALKELRYSFHVFSKYRSNRKVTVFGSARTKTEAPAYQQTVKFGRRMAEEGWMVLTGAGGGIMEAAHVGAGRAMSMGVNIMLPFEQSANPVIAGDDKLINLKYFFTRKLLFVKEVHGIVLFPGGFGTMDEGFETLTLVQTGKRDMMPIVCVDEPGGQYWAKFREFVETQLLHEELISPDDMSLFCVTDDVEVAVAEVMNFYRVFDSMRYIREALVLRLRANPSDEYVEQLNEQYQDVIVSGRIERVGVHAFESDEAHLAHLTRLRMKFNRRKLGRLRQLIDQLNRDLTPFVKVA